MEVVRKAYAAYHGGDAEAALSYFHPEVVSDASRRLAGGIAHGREELRQQVAEWVGAFDGYREEVEEILDLHDRVCVVVTQRGEGRGSGVGVDQTYAVIYEVEDEWITALTAYRTRADALEAAGLSE